MGFRTSIRKPGSKATAGSNILSTSIEKTLTSEFVSSERRKKAICITSRVGWFSDDRLNWRKSTHSAARYLNELGRRFNYDWRLALAGYNGGPNYLAKRMKKQRSRNFWQLKLRKETKEYVPKFLAMLKVGRERYPDLFFQGAPRYWVASR